MGISKINTVQEEETARISLIVRGDEHGVQIDNTITPIFCCNCNQQLDGFYKLEGSRYGQVGTVICNCGAEIHCTDSDNIVEYLNTFTLLKNNQVGKYKIDYKKLYRLEKDDWELIKSRKGFDIVSKYKNKTVDLEDIIIELTLKFNFSDSGYDKKKSDKFNQLPIVVNKWISILNWIE